jgi:hypothetical protein
MKVRIKGLIKFFNHVRERLQAGIPPGEVTAFRENVQRITQQVEIICKEHGGNPSLLPAPSRNAYLFLKNLDLNNLPISQSKETPVRNQTIHMKNVVSTGEHFAAKLWREADNLLPQPEEMEKLLNSIEAEATSLERICAKNGGTPANLAVPSRQVYCWLKFLARKENLTAHLQTLQTVKRLIQQLPSSYHSISIEVWMLNMQALYRVRSYRNQLLIKCNEGLLNAGENIWQVILKGIFEKRSIRRKEAFAHYIASEDFSGVLFEMESFIENSPDTAKGHAHDLDASFERVNQGYFLGKMSKPALKWNRLLTVAKMGHYQSSQDTVMLSLSLDHAEVPEYVVDFVMYHELLHKKHGETILNGRRFVHTPEFRREEQQFEKFAEASAFLNRLARRQRGLSDADTRLTDTVKGVGESKTSSRAKKTEKKRPFSFKKKKKKLKKKKKRRR